MKQLFYSGTNECYIPGVEGRFDPGCGKNIGTGPDEVPQAIADRFALYPGWAVREAAEDTGAAGAPGINASKGAITAAAAAGIDLAECAIEGTGKDGQIIKTDVDAYVVSLNS